MLAFAQRHGHTEAQHLERVERWLAPHRRSRLLSIWRLAGWLTGALPALAGRRAVYATITAVETFVDLHYQQQIDHVRASDPFAGADELLALLQECQADECAHRDEAQALAGANPSWILRGWCAMVSIGSSGAVVLARRI